MPCQHVKFPDGSSAILCFKRGPVPRCRFCHGPGGLLCDHVVASGRTCDARMCARCATQVGPDRHLCPEHKLEANQRELFA